MFYVYILEDEEGRHYIGTTSKDPLIRLKEHNTGKSRWTRRSKSWRLIYTETFSDRRSAWLREQQIKRYKGGNAFKKLMERCESG
ncbi:MAG: GIY-YIG nuclease family protein [Candidatus Omnitrophota bacterium]